MKRHAFQNQGVSADAWYKSRFKATACLLVCETRCVSKPHCVCRYVTKAALQNFVDLSIFETNYCSNPQCFCCRAIQLMFQNHGVSVDKWNKVRFKTIMCMPICDKSCFAKLWLCGHYDLGICILENTNLGSYNLRTTKFGHRTPISCMETTKNWHCPARFCLGPQILAVVDHSIAWKL